MQRQDSVVAFTQLCGNAIPRTCTKDCDDEMQSWFGVCPFTSLVGVAVRSFFLCVGPEVDTEILNFINLG